MISFASWLFCSSILFYLLLSTSLAADTSRPIAETHEKPYSQGEQFASPLPSELTDTAAKVCYSSNQESSQQIVECTTATSSTAIVLISISNSAVANLSRPWLPTTLNRIEAYAGRTGSDVVVVRSSKHCDHLSRKEADKDDAQAQRDCAMRGKLDAIYETLMIYDRILLVDDTVVIRGDTPNLFEIVPPERIGALVQSDAIFGEAENRRQLDEMCEFYGVDNKDASSTVFNSGVLLLTREYHKSMFRDRFSQVQTRSELFGDQGYLNAMAHSTKQSVYDIEYRCVANEEEGSEDSYIVAPSLRSPFPSPSVLLSRSLTLSINRYNFLGSFETYNLGKLKLSAIEAYIVHATTGLLSKFVEIDGNTYLTQMEGDEGMEYRTKYIDYVDEEWRKLGV